MVGRTPATFCFIVNRDGPEGELPAVEAEPFAAMEGILAAVKRVLE